MDQSSGKCYGAYRESDRSANCVELKDTGIEHALRVVAWSLIGSGGFVGDIRVYTIPLINPNPTLSDCRSSRCNSDRCVVY